MALIIKIAVLSMSILVLSACGGGGTNTDNGETPDPETPLTATDNPTPEPDVSTPETDPPTSEPEVTTPEPTEPEVTIPEPEPETPTTEPETTIPEPEVTTPDPVIPPPSSGAVLVKNQAQAALFLNRATFGPTENDINNLLSKSTYENWVIEQFNTTTTYHLPDVKNLGRRMCANINDDGSARIDSWEYRFPRHHVWWEAATKANDQLRQRIALALSEILVVSDSDGLGLSQYHLAVTSYYDVLVKHAFGNYRDLLEDVALHPAMGDFLSMSRNQKENTEGTIRPDENFARENLQLFTIGVHELNVDGTKKRDGNNNFIPTYDQKTIEEFAKVFTGWSYADKDWKEWPGEANRLVPLKAFEEYHDTSAKTLLNGEISPSGQSAQEDLEFALDNIFKHPNIAPYISKQLIQRLVTSNPTPQYVARVAEKFNNNGNGIKGDMKAVVSAILLDEEALAENKPDNFGKLREPMLRMSHLWRVFNMKTSLRIGHYWDSDKRCGYGAYPSYNFYSSLPNFNKDLGQGPLQARSVFNFFRPDFSPTGLLNDNGIAAPEFQIINENTMVSATNLYYKLIEKFSTDQGFTPALEKHSEFDMRDITNLAENTDNLLDYLNLVLLNKEMSSSLRTILAEHLNAADIFNDDREGQFQKAREAVMLIIGSPEYLIQR